MSDCVRSPRRWPCKRMSCVMLLRLISIDFPFSSGCLGILWSFAWFALVYDSPTIHPSVDEEEKRIFDKDGSKILVASASVVWRRKMNLALNTVTRYAHTHASVGSLNISHTPPLPSVSFLVSRLNWRVGFTYRWFSLLFKDTFYISNSLSRTNKGKFKKVFWLKLNFSQDKSLTGNRGGGGEEIVQN